MTMSVSRKVASPFDLFHHIFTADIEVWIGLGAKDQNEWEKAWIQSPSVNILVEMGEDGVYDLEDEDQIHNCSEPQAVFRKPGMAALGIYVKQQYPWDVQVAAKAKYVDPIDHSKYRCINPA